MKKILLLMMLCATSIYTKEFPEGLNNTKWKEVDLKNNKDYYTLEFNGRFETDKLYKNNKLEDISTYKMSNHQIQGNLLFVWYEEWTNPGIFEMRYDLTEYGEIVLLYYGFNTKDENSLMRVFIPLVE